MSFSIYDLAAKEHAVLDVVHPVTKKPTGARITIAGPASDEYATQKARLGLVLKAGDITPEQAEQENVKFLAGCIIGWEGMGVDFSPPEAIKLLSDKHMYPFKNWLDEQIISLGNFISA